MNLSTATAALSFASLAPKVVRTIILSPNRNILRSSTRFERSTTLFFHHHRVFSSHSTTTTTTTSPSTSNNNSSRMSSREPIYWNRENRPSADDAAAAAAARDGPIIKEARILALSDPNDPHNAPLYRGPLPEGARLLKVGSHIDDFRELSSLDQEHPPNVVFVSHPSARDPLVRILETFPTVEWIHSRSAGVDFLASTALFESTAMLTNAKGMFSSTLAEYCMMACSYFAKDLPRWTRQKTEANWEQYPVRELRGATLGIVGYGDIGRACAKLAKAYGMKVVGLKRDVLSSTYRHEEDPYCDAVYYGVQGLHEVMSQSDYILISTPLTEQTRGLVSKEAIGKCKPSAVIINVGRGPVIDEEALIEALQNGTIYGAGLDVFSVEPLPRDHPLWKLDNVLLSPHNADMTMTFMRESTEFFIHENLPRFVRGKQLLNPVNKAVGY